MWTLHKRFVFEASHQLPHHDGKCARLHGHSWVGWIEVQGTTLQASGSQTGMVMDYGVLAEALTPVVEDFLDHWHLNDSTGLESPTSEALARWVFTQVHQRLPSLVAVCIQETCTSECVYRP